MGSNYKKLGPYIQVVNERNSNLNGNKLLGVSIRKCFMTSIANTIGTDMSTYKLIKKNQFAYGPVTSRNGDKISVALLDEYENGLVSQAYVVFEIIDTNELDPEYLMMWFRRPEFDRYARFKSHGSAREIFDWSEMCETELPIPSIEKQKEIVSEYNIIQNRIALNNQLINKLEETAQAIYKQWFEDFEFPDENGLPYKSNGGEMVWFEELEKEIPEGWSVDEFQKITEVTSGKSLKSEIGKNHPVYGAGGITGYTDDFLFDKTIIIIGRVGTHGKVFIEYDKSWPTDNTLVFIPKYLYYP
jgi:type I restriction enzyme S subunit